MKGITCINGKTVKLLTNLGEDVLDYIAEETFIPSSWVDKLVAFFSLPDQVDLRLNFPDVRDQGSKGICTSMGLSAIKGYQEGSSKIFSPMFINNCQTDKEMERAGLSPREALKRLRKIGVVLESDYPITKKEGDEIPEKLFSLATPYQILMFFRVLTKYGIQWNLKNDNPVGVVLPVYDGAPGTAFWKGEGEPAGYHFVVFVGYDKKKKHFIGRNSWGVDWGNSGDFYFPFNDYKRITQAWVAIDRKNDTWRPKRRLFWKRYRKEKSLQNN